MPPPRPARAPASSWPPSTNRAAAPTPAYCFTPLPVLPGLGKSRSLEFSVGHITCDDLIVLGHPFDHQPFDQLADTEFEFIDWVRQRGLDHLLVLAGLSLICWKNKRSSSLNSVPKRSFNTSMISDSGAVSS